MQTWIKFCGTTNLADALASVEAGANAVGFVFADSPRRVDQRQVAAITKGLPATAGVKIEKIGVFVNEPVASVVGIARAAGLTGVQLHGEESPEYVKDLKRSGAAGRIFKTVPAASGKTAELGSFEGGEALVDALLVDAGSKILRGGTGQAFDWLASLDFILGLERHGKVIIAGGLNQDNVAAALSLFRPYGVDVTSGVEREPGKKDPVRLKAFVAAVRAADAAHPTPR